MNLEDVNLVPYVIISAWATYLNIQDCIKMKFKLLVSKKLWRNVCTVFMPLYFYSWSAKKCWGDSVDKVKCNTFISLLVMSVLYCIKGCHLCQGQQIYCTNGFIQKNHIFLSSNNNLSTSLRVYI